MAADSTIHASAVLAGPKAVLIRGPSGSGKSLLAWNLINAASQGLLTFTRLVGDDRLQVVGESGRLLVRPAQALSGLIEIHGLGIRRLPFEPIAVVGLGGRPCCDGCRAASRSRSHDRFDRGSYNSATCRRSRNGRPADGVGGLKDIPRRQLTCRGNLGYPRHPDPN